MGDANLTLNKMLAKISLLDRYIIKQLIPPLGLGIVAFTIIGELVGISFEQIRFIVHDSLPFALSFQVHYLKLPQFIVIALPLSCLFATIIIYSKLAKKQELVACQSFGVSLYRLAIPGLILSLIMGLTMFIFHETIVPEANYQAALLLETHWQVDRNLLKKYNKKALLYPQFKYHNQQQEIESIFIADRVKEKKTYGVTILQFQEEQLEQIIISQSAIWNERKKAWDLFNGHQNIINPSTGYSQRQDFKQLSLNLPKNIIDYVANNRDNREMSIWQLYQRLNIIKPVAKAKDIRKLKIKIQERYSMPFACVVFGFLGSVFGITTKTTGRGNNSGIIVLIIFVYYMMQFISTALAVTGAIPLISGVWLPNLLAIVICCYLLSYQKVKLPFRSTQINLTLKRDRVIIR